MRENGLPRLALSRDDNARNDRGTIGRLDRADRHDDDDNGRVERDVPRSDDGTLNAYTRADMLRDNARRGLGPLQISKGR